MLDNLERDDENSDNPPVKIPRLSLDSDDLRHDAVAFHLTNAFWNIDNSNLLTWDPAKPESTNEVFIGQWDRIKQRKEFQLFGRPHSDICNVIP